MDWQEWINLIVAIVVAAPVSILIAQVLKKAAWADGAKAVLATIVCVGVGVAQTWIAGDLLGLIGRWGTLTATDVLAWAGAVFAAAQIEYQAYFKGQPWMVKLGEWWPRG